ncbi:MAG: DUF533 domain-containing protein [Kofleriaceae bacterium]|nr:DUF533 domain-containing protein [Myxococcales bacterium]MCB9563307.1 DUF533 domain-containing protein [Kofleriaceae bacterium]MCB9572233.1 DUF533 domain-containing protein [Kofleriaceae bacterium]
MSESPFLSVIRVWAAMVWADGVVAPAEAKALRRLIDAAELTDDERGTAHKFLEQRVDLDTVGVADLSEDARRGIYRAACRIAAVDREVAGSERELLDRLRGHLGIALEVAKDIEAGIPGL